MDKSKNINKKTVKVRGSLDLCNKIVGLFRLSSKFICAHLGIFLLCAALFAGAQKIEASNLEASDSEASDLEASDSEVSDLEASDSEASDLEPSNSEASSPEAPVDYGKKFPVITDEIKGWPKAPENLADTCVLMDAATGEVIYSKGADEKHFPASITKVMTLLIALEKGDPDSIVDFTETGVAYVDWDSSNLGTKVGEQIKLRDCEYGTLFRSANDMATQIGEHIGGSLEKFVSEMNDRAKNLGCKNTHFVNACGMHDDNHYTTAYDMALIAREAYANKDFRALLKEKEYVIPQTNKMKEKRYLENQYSMIWQESPHYYEYSAGGKTGFTDEALNTLVSFSDKDGEAFVCVVLYCPGKDNAYNATKELFEYGYNNFKRIDYKSDNSKDDIKLLIPSNLSKDDISEKVNGEDVELSCGNYVLCKAKADVKKDENADKATESNINSAASSSSKVNTPERGVASASSGIVSDAYDEFADGVFGVPLKDMLLYISIAAGVLAVILAVVLIVTRRRR